MRKHNISGESTVTRKRATRKLTMGIDVGDRSSPYCILDEHGEVLAEGSVATTKKGWPRYLDRNRGADWRWKWGRILPG